MKPYKLTNETETHYELHDGKAPFRVAKNGLSDGTKKQIKQYFANGAEAVSPEMSYSLAPSQGAAGTPFSGQQLTQSDLDSSQGPVLDVGPYASGTPVPLMIPGSSTKRIPGSNTPVISSSGHAYSPESSVPDFTPRGAGATPSVQGRNAPPIPRPSGGSQSEYAGAGDMRRGYEEMRKGMLAQAEGEKEQNRQRAEIIKDQMAHGADLEARQAQMDAAYQSRRQQEQDKFAELTRKYSSTEIDPQRFWANQSTGSKVLAGIGLVLGGIGAGATGVNQSVGIINSAIEKDIDAQKANMANQGQGIQQQGQLLSIMKANYGEDSQAMAATRATYYQRVGQQLEEMAARTADPIKKGQLQATLGQFQQQYGAEQNKMAMAAHAAAAQDKMLEARTAAMQAKAGQQVNPDLAIDRAQEAIKDLATQHSKIGLSTYAGPGTLPGSGASKYEEELKFNGPLLWKAVKGGSRVGNLEEMKAFQEEYLPTKNDSKTRAREKFSALLRALERQRGLSVASKSNGNSGYAEGLEETE